MAFRHQGLVVFQIQFAKRQGNVPLTRDYIVEAEERLRAVERHGPHGWVTVEPGAWNTGWHHGTGFVQWTGSTAQQQALTRVAELSEAVDAARRNAIAIGAGNPTSHPTTDIDGQSRPAGVRPDSGADQK